MLILPTGEGVHRQPGDGAGPAVRGVRAVPVRGLSGGAGVYHCHRAWYHAGTG